MLKDVTIGFPSKETLYIYSRPDDLKPTVSRDNINCSITERPNITVPTTGLDEEIRSMVLDDTRVLIAAPFNAGTRVTIIRFLNDKDEGYYKEYHIPMDITKRPIDPFKCILSYFLLNGSMMFSNREKKKILGAMMPKLSRVPVNYQFGRYRIYIQEDLKIKIKSKHGFYIGDYHGITECVRNNLNGKNNDEHIRR